MNKRDLYWEARAVADEKRSNALAGKASAEINAMYRRQYKKIVKNLRDLGEQVEFGKPLSRTQLWNYSRWKTLVKSLSEFVDDATRMETSTVEKTLDEVFKKTIGADVGGFTQGGAQLTTPAINVIDTEWSGANYSTRIWNNNAAIADRMKNEMEDMLIQGKGLPDIRRIVMKEFGVAFNDADRIVRTEAAYVLNRAAVERYKRANLRKVRWSTGPEDGNECEICAARANKVYLIGSEPRIPAHPRCRCVYAGVVELPGEDVEVDGPAADRRFAEKEYLRKQENGLKSSEKNGIIKASDLGSFKKKLRGDANVDDLYYDKLKTKFAHGTDDAKKAFSKFASGDTVIDTKTPGFAGYSPKDKKVHMCYLEDAIANPRGAGATYFHEHGHLIDDAAGYPSHDSKFSMLLNADQMDYRIRYGKENHLGTYDKIDSAISRDLSKPRRCSAISDLMAGLTGFNITGGYSHDPQYYNVESISEEAFAHMFESQFDKLRHEEMRKYFPTALTYFEETILKGLIT